MINKELLSAVLGIEIVRIHHSGYWLMYWTLYKNGKEKRNQINIHELAHKIKEWARKKRYAIISGIDMNGFWQYKAKVKYNDRGIIKEIPYKFANTEPEAIFKACNYILENLKQ